MLHRVYRRAPAGVTAATMDDPVFEICGSAAPPIVCEQVPSSVAKRYRSIKYVSAAALVAEFNDQWFIKFVPNAKGESEEIVLTVTGGSHVPDQPEVTCTGASNSRGTLIVTAATSKLLTGSFCVKFLQSNPNAHDIFVTTRGFQPPHSRTRQPEDAPAQHLLRKNKAGETHEESRRPEIARPGHTVEYLPGPQSEKLRTMVFTTTPPSSTACNAAVQRWTAAWAWATAWEP